MTVSRNIKNTSFGLIATALLALQPAACGIGMPEGAFGRVAGILKDTAEDAVQSFNAHLLGQMATAAYQEANGQPSNPPSLTAVAKASLFGLPQQIMARQSTQFAYGALNRAWNPEQNPNKRFLVGKLVGTGYGTLAQLAAKRSLKQTICGILPSLCIAFATDVAHHTAARMVRKAGVQEPEFLTRFQQSGVMRSLSFLLPISQAIIPSISQWLLNKAFSTLWGYGQMSQYRKMLAARQHPHLAAQAQAAH